MSEWIDVVVYAALIVTVWGWLPVWRARFTAPVLADRNPEWAASHPEVVQKLTGSPWFRWSCFLWGALSVGVLLAVQIGMWPEALSFALTAPKWEALKDVNSTLLIIGVVPLLGSSAYFVRWLHTNVPLAERRHATLVRRSIGDHVPRGFQVAVFGAVVFHLTAWLTVGMLGRYSTGWFWGTLAFQFAISAVFLFIALGAVRRRPNAMDRIFGPGYRRTEMRWAFAAQLLPLLNGAARLYEQVANTVPVDVNRMLHLGVALLVVALAISSTLRFRTTRDSAGAQRRTLHGRPVHSP